MQRRDFLLGVTEVLMSTTAVTAQGRWSNGALQAGAFYWTNGGGDPYRGSLSQALGLAGIHERRAQGLLQRAVQAAPGGNSQPYTIQDGDRLGVMISGTGWVARNTVAMPSRWRRGSRTALVWYVDDPATGVQYRMLKAQVCGNWIFQYYGAPEQCRCQVGVDAC